MPIAPFHFLIARAAEITPLTPINPNLPGTEASGGPLGIVLNAYTFSLMLGGVLAFVMIVWGGIEHITNAGNPSKVSDANDRIVQALFGLLLLAGAYIILNLVNPQLTKLTIPSLTPIQVATSTGVGGVSGGVTCQQHADAHPGANSCADSPSLSAIIGCVSNNIHLSASYTTQGSHNANSCHFGGVSCTDGGHAVDYGFNAITANSLTPNMVISNVVSCGAQKNIPVACRCENNGGSSILPCDDPAANHIHCNVDVGSCGCN